MNKLNQMYKFNFLIGTWKLKYKVPKSQFCDIDSGEGEGKFKRILKNNYVVFDYQAKLSKNKTAAHGIFAWDKISQNYKYWWFEDSGAFMEATCNFKNKNTIFMNWHNGQLTQSFQLIESGEVILQMKKQTANKVGELLLEVIFTKIK